MIHPIQPLVTTKSILKHRSENTLNLSSLKTLSDAEIKQNKFNSLGNIPPIGFLTINTFGEVNKNNYQSKETTIMEESNDDERQSKEINISEVVDEDEHEYTDELKRKKPNPLLHILNIEKAKDPNFNSLDIPNDIDSNIKYSSDNTNKSSVIDSIHEKRSVHFMPLSNKKLKYTN